MKTKFPRHEQAIAYALKQIKASPLAPFVQDVILFGSVARGEERFVSDVDLLLVLKDAAYETEDIARQCRMLKVLVSTDDIKDAETDLRIVRASYFHASQELIDYFIKKEGKSVWE